jgi:hypothetical protein
VRRIILTFGLISGALLSAMMAMTLPFLDQIGFDRGMVVGYTTMVLAFLLVYFGVRSYRDTIGGGQVTFGRAVLVGLGITAVATACYVATWEIIYFFVTPDFGEKYAAYAIEKARASGASAAELARTTREMAEFQEMYRNPLINIAYTSLEPLPVGLLFTLVAAGLLSRRRGPKAATATA